MSFCALCEDEDFLFAMGEVWGMNPLLSLPPFLPVFHDLA
jgi:hypothetical protein